MRKKPRKKTNLEILVELFEGKKGMFKQGIFSVEYGMKVSFLEMPEVAPAGGISEEDWLRR